MNGISDDVFLRVCVQNQSYESSSTVTYQNMLCSLNEISRITKQSYNNMKEQDKINVSHTAFCRRRILMLAVYFTIIIYYLKYILLIR